MPGLVGVITNRPHQEAELEVGRMLTEASHESRYSSARLCEPALGLYTGWTYHPGALASEMPLKSGNGLMDLVLAGSEHSPVGRSARQSQTGEYRSAQQLAALWEGAPERFLQTLNGWFVGLIVDRSVGRVTLFNDRFGMGRLYISESADGFYFASDVKALLGVRPDLRRLDETGLAEWLCWGAPLGDRTLFSGISVLPSAASWTFAAGKTPVRAQYFSMAEWEAQEALPADQAVGAFQEVFTQVLPEYFPTGKRVGMSVTGGLDSRLVLACLERNVNVTCYTFGGMRGDTYDVRIGRAVSEASGCEHQAISLGPDFLSTFPQLARDTIALSGGLHDVCGAHDVYFNRIAREIAPLRLSGKFGSEIVRQSRHFGARLPARGLFADGLESLFPAALIGAEDLPSNPVSFAAFAEIPLHEYGRLAVEQSQLVFDTPYMDNEVVKLMYRVLPAMTEADRVPIEVIRRVRPELLRIMTDRGVRGRGRVRDWLSERFYWTLLYKTEWRFNNQPSRAWARAADLGIGRLFAGRHILTNYREWFSGPLREFVADTLLSKKFGERGIYQPKRIEGMLGSMMAGGSSYLFEIAKALDVELIHQCLLER